MIYYEKIIRLITGSALGYAALILPIFTAQLATNAGLNFWLGFVIVFISLIFSGIFIFMATAMIGPAYPGIASRINRKWRSLTSPFIQSIVRILYTLGFAGQNSRWQLLNAKNAGFLAGLWHGLLIFPSAIIIIILTNEIDTREPGNNDFRYSFGLFLGLALTIYFLLYLLNLQ